ncbi:MAG: HD domain-containing protein [Deltaproteobacteria bacterium]|nr:HD domain-containing protein [Deltaproteobacteria bacterium]
MGAEQTQPSEPIVAPDGAAEEFAAAIEASAGQSLDLGFGDPMDGVAVRDAFEQILLSAHPDRALEVLIRSGVMEAVLPEVAALVGFGEGIRHKDVWEHTKRVVRQSPCRPEVRWAALLHDIGKVPTRRFEPEGQVTFIGHPEVGARMFDRIAGRIPLDDRMRERVRFLIGSHLRASAYDGNWTDSAIRRFTRDMGQALEDLLDLSRADITSKYADKVRRGLRQIDELADRVSEIKELDATPPPLPTGLGRAIIDQLGVAPGPALGAMMRQLKAAVADGRLTAQRDFEHYLEFLRRQK